MKISMRVLRFTFLTSVVATVQASAQTPRVADDFSALAGTGPSIVVLDDAGKETKGRLVRFDPQSFTMTAGGRDLTFDRQHVTRVYQRGDPLKNGMLIGLVTGAAIGFAGGVSISDCGFFVPQPCSARTKARVGAVLGGMLGAIGLGIGVATDALITGRRLIYERPRRAESAAIFIVPSFARSSASVSLNVGW
jgi:hypothetical protein